MIPKFDIYSRSFQDNPYPLYATLREEAPIYWSDDHDFWLVSRYEDVSAVLKNTADFSSSPATSGGIERGEKQPPLISDDPPIHTRLRRLIGQAFTPKRVADMEPRLRDTVTHLIDDVVDKGRNGSPLDFVDLFSGLLPVIAIGAILGAKEEDFGRLRQWGMQAATASQGDLDARARRSELRGEIGEYFVRLAADRLTHPQDDLLTAIAQAADSEHQQLLPEEMAGFCTILWQAGNETTRNLITNAVISLQDHPREEKRVRHDHSLIPPFIEETMRHQAPVQGLFRRATGEIQIRDQHIKTGDILWVLFASANRDERQFPNPDRFETTRTPNQHVGFGHGIHYCIGAPLARLEGRLALEGLLSRLPDLRVEPSSGQRVPTPQLRGFNSLPMAL